MSKQKSKKKNGKIGLQLVISIALVEILLGALLLFVPQIEITTLCYLLSAALVVAGIFLIVKYFMADAYKNINEYGFSVGAFFVILGMCALVRVEQVSTSFLLCMGIVLLMTSVIKFQNALDLKYLEEKYWIGVMVVSFIFMACSVAIIINPFKSIHTLQLFTYRLLMIDGFVSLFSNLYLFYKIKQNGKEDIVQVNKTYAYDEEETENIEDEEDENPNAVEEEYHE